MKSDRSMGGRLVDIEIISGVRAGFLAQDVALRLAPHPSPLPEREREKRWATCRWGSVRMPRSMRDRALSARRARLCRSPNFARRNGRADRA